MVDKNMVHKFIIIIFSECLPWKMAQCSINQNITSEEYCQMLPAYI